MNVKEVNVNDVKIVENVRSAVKNLESFMQEIKTNGLKHPIGVLATKSKEFILVYGHRRLSACRKLGWKTIPANVYPEDMDIKDLLTNNVTENIHREDISPMELGRICDKLNKMDLTISEIAVRLNIPATRVRAALDVFNSVPAKHRSRIAFINGSTSKNGNISATVAAKIIATKRQFGLSEPSVEKIINNAKSHEFTTQDMSLFASLMDSGLSVTQALNAMDEYTYHRVDIIVNDEKIEAHCAKYKIDSRTMLIQSIVYGLIPPIKKPDFFRIKQVPVGL